MREKWEENILIQFFLIFHKTNLNDAYMQNFIQIPQKMKTRRRVPNVTKLVKLTLYMSLLGKTSLKSM